MILSPSASRIESQKTYDLARQREWEQVFEIVDRHSLLEYPPDLSKEHYGWTLTDHAVFQENLEAIQRLEILNLKKVPRNEIIKAFIDKGNWEWIIALLKAKVISPNVVYIFDDCSGTLLDLAQGSPYPIIRNLRAFNCLFSEELIMFDMAQKNQWDMLANRWPIKKIDFTARKLFSNGSFTLSDIAKSQNREDIVALLESYKSLSIKKMFQFAQTDQWFEAFQLLSTLDIAPNYAQAQTGLSLLDYAYITNNKVAFYLLITSFCDPFFQESCDHTKYSKYENYYSSSELEFRRVHSKDMTTDSNWHPMYNNHKKQGIQLLKEDYPNDVDLPISLEKQIVKSNERSRSNTSKHS